MLKQILISFSTNHNHRVNKIGPLGILPNLWFQRSAGSVEQLIVCESAVLSAAEGM